MTVMIKSLTGASSAWDTTPWQSVHKQVKQLQMRIAKAVREKRYGQVKALQWLLTHSYYGKLLAVKRVTQSVGAKTPGVDGVMYKTSHQKIKAVHTLQRHGYKAQPLRRVYIPKRQGVRPLSIPTMKDRSMQALHLLALEPVMESIADKNTYGFRPKRSTADAIEQCFKVLAKRTSASWVLEGDIRACFDKVSGAWLKDHSLMDKVMLNSWLTAGYIEKENWYTTVDGVPQGGIISPALLVLALSGLEERLKRGTSLQDKVHFIGYADDFIISGATKDILENKVMPIVVAFLRERGLELSQEKTKITSIKEGFDFLGFNVRKYKNKLLIKPARSHVKTFLHKIRALIKINLATKTEDLLGQLNPKIRGWANYYRHVVAKETFNFIDSHIYKALRRWIKRRHPKKSEQWLYNKYFRCHGFRRWIFSVKLRTKEKQCLDLFTASQVPIRRHVKIKAQATPYDPEYKDYFLKRDQQKLRT